MAERKRGLTRREIMSGAVSLPIVAAVGCALNDPSTENVETVYAAAARKIPPGQLKEIGDKAHADYGVSKTFFECIAAELWVFFAAGVEDKSKGAATIDDSKKIPFKAGYKKSGKFIAQNIKDAKWPADCRHPMTNVCAYRCGEHAAVLALQTNDKVVTEKIFKDAWALTKADVGRTLERATAMTGNEAAVESDGSVMGGLGC